MFVVEQGEFPIIETKINFRRWSWPLIISILGNLLFFYILAYIINSKNEKEHTATVLRIVLAENKVQAEQKEIVKTVSVKKPKPKPVKPKPEKPIKDIAKVVPKTPQKKIIEPKIQEPTPPEPVVDQLIENWESVETKLQESIDLAPKSVTMSVKPVPLFKLTRQPGGIKGEPEYPEHARAMGREAYVMASVVIDIDGSVIEVEIVESGGEEFDEAITQWLLKQQLEPGLVNDTPVVSKIIQPFTFVLR